MPDSSFDSTSLLAVALAAWGTVELEALLVVVGLPFGSVEKALVFSGVTTGAGAATGAGAMP